MRLDRTMTERDGRGDQVGELERWDAAQAARAMGVAHSVSEELNDALLPPSRGSAHHARPKIAAALVLGTGVASVFIARHMLTTGQHQEATAASDANTSAEDAYRTVIGAVADQPGQRSTVLEWSVSQGGNGHWYQLASLGRGLDATDGTPIQGVIGIEGALDLARRAGAELVTIHSQEEHDFVHRLVAARYPRCRGFRVLTGGVRTKDGFAWRNGETFDFDLLSPSHPVHPPGSPIVIGMGPENAWCPSNPTGCWMTFPATERWAFHVTVLEWASKPTADRR
jgi:hypothetical protein